MNLDEDLRDRLEQLHSAVVCDVTDEMGLRDNAFPNDIRPVWGRQTVVGTAHTVQLVRVGHETDEHYQRVLDSIAAAESGDIFVRSTPDDVNVGMWGELLSSAARSKGAVGAIVDGPTRDARGIEDIQFPVWATGHSPVDSVGRVDTLEGGIPVDVGGVKVHPGDVILADYEGVVRVPQDAVEETAERAEEKLETEGEVQRELEAGRPFEEVYREHRTL